MESKQTCNPLIVRNLGGLERGWPRAGRDAPGGPLKRTNAAGNIVCAQDTSFAYDRTNSRKWRAAGEETRSAGGLKSTRQKGFLKAQSQTPQLSTSSHLRLIRIGEVKFRLPYFELGDSGEVMDYDNPG